jgi:putative membrane protein
MNATMADARERRSKEMAQGAWRGHVFRVFVMASCLWMAACGGSADDAADTLADSAAATTPTPPPAGPTLTDAEIAHVAVTANAIDIEAGELAKRKSQHEEVLAFAETMIADHTGVNQQASTLAQRLNVTPANNTVSEQLRSDADQAKTRLDAMSGAEFDRAYMDREIEYHRAVLGALDNTLIPGAQNAELKALLQNVRPAVDAHLQRAQQIRAALGG